MSIDLSGYNDVAARMIEFRDKYPEGCLQPADPAKPFEVVTVGDRVFIAYTAAAYRTAADPRPGIGVAWEPFPGSTNFTRDSELQNAETSAWGRAILAVGAADAKKGVASREEVRNRQADRDAEWEQAEKPPTDEQVAVCDSLSAEIAAVTRRVDIGQIGGRVKHARAEGLLTAAQYRALGVKANERIAELLAEAAS